MAACCQRLVQPPLFHDAVSTFCSSDHWHKRLCLPGSKRERVSFPDLPEALTGGERSGGCLREGGGLPGGSESRAASHVGRISRYLRAQNEIKHRIGVPLPIAPKLALYLAIRERGVANTEWHGDWE